MAKQDAKRAAGESKTTTTSRRPEKDAHRPAPASELELDRVIHERLRLGILSALAVNRSLTFNELKKLLGTSDGNLSVHARKLEEAEYVSCEKTFQGRMPKTEYKLTAGGRKALERYLDEMESLIKSTRGQKK